MVCNRLRKQLTAFQVLLFTTLHKLSVSQEVACSLRDSILIDSTCFIYYDINVTWHEAKILCEKKETLLAKVLSGDHVRNILANYSVQINITGGSFGVWVGANDLKQEGSFHWLDDGASVVEDVWESFEPSQPTNFEEDCAAINSSMRLSAVYCGLRHSFLCMHEVVIPVRYFKPPYNLHCHCSDGICDENGECSSRKCALHWFGESCQYRKIPNNLDGLLGVLNDNNDYSCISDPVNPLHVKFGQTHYFTWIQIVLGVIEEGIYLKCPQDNQQDTLDQQDGFELEFPDHTGKCENLIKITVDRMKVNLYCISGPTEANNFKLSWRGHKTICSIYINGGRNLIFLNSTYQIAPDPEPNKGDYYPVDGNKERGGTCTQAIVKAGQKNYVVKLGNPLLIREIILYRRVNTSGYSHMIPASISGLSNNAVKFRFEFNSSLDHPVVWFRTDTKEAIDTIRVSLNSGSANNRLLDICEIEAYSACPEGKYGLLCDNNCMGKCNATTCLDNGGCFHVPSTLSTTGHVTRKSGSSSTVASISTTNKKPSTGMNIYVNASVSPTGSGSERSPPRVTTVLNNVTNIENWNTTRDSKNTTAPPYRNPEHKTKLLYLAFSMIAVGVLCCLCLGLLCCMHRREVQQEVKAETVDLDFDYDEDEGSRYFDETYSRTTTTSKYGGKSQSQSYGLSVTGSSLPTSETSHTYSTIDVK